jgi:hypothetical protein
MLYHAIHKPVWRNGIRACLKNKSPYGVEGSNLSTGIPRPQLSVAVDPVLIFPSRHLLVSLKIHCCLSVLLSVLLSVYTV